jgi:aminoglycoside phosphotransferase (APT) family kinase protein
VSEMPLTDATTELAMLSHALFGPRTSLRDLLARPGTRVVLLAGSKDPNAKCTMLLMDDAGPAFAVKIPTTSAAATVVRTEGDLLESLHACGLGRLATTLPRAIGYLDADGLDALVTSAVTGQPMTVRYHAYRHTARRRRVRADFAAAGDWLAELQARSAGPRVPVTLLSRSLAQIARRFHDDPAAYPAAAGLRRALAGPAAQLSTETTPRTVVHGDFWMGNLLLSGDTVVGVVDWEAGTLSGEPLRDVARFAVSYSLYLDRHTRSGGRVAGHRGLRADSWGAGLRHAVDGQGWYPDLVRRYLPDALSRLGVSPGLWREVLLAGIAEVAATADHPEFARQHLRVLCELCGVAT